MGITVLIYSFILPCQGQLKMCLSDKLFQSWVLVTRSPNSEILSVSVE